MKCALVVSHDFVKEPLSDEQLLAFELGRRGIKVDIVCWQDPTFDWSTTDVALVRATWDIADKLDEYLAWTQHVSSQTFLLQRAPALEWSCNKWLVLSELEKQGFPVIPTLQIPTNASIRDLAHACQWRNHLMIKPTVSFNGDGILLVDTSNENDCELAQMMVIIYQGLRRQMLMHPCHFLSGGIHQHTIIGGLWSHALVRHEWQIGKEERKETRVVDPISPSYTEVQLATRIMHCIDRQFGPLLCGVVELVQDAERLFVLDVEVGSPLLGLRWGYSLPWMADLLREYIAFSRQRRAS